MHPCKTKYLQALVYFSLCASLPQTAQAAISVTSTADDGSVGTLRYAINQVNQGSATSPITFAIGGTIIIMSSLPPIGSLVSPLTITMDTNGHAVVITSDTSDSGLFILPNTTFTLSNSSGGSFRENGMGSNGGAGGSAGGGGGLGAGGGLLVRGTATINGITFFNCLAAGGPGAGPSGSGGGGGGGMSLADGGGSIAPPTGGGGGGGFGNLTNGGFADTTGGGGGGGLLFAGGDSGDEGGGGGGSDTAIGNDSMAPDGANGATGSSGVAGTGGLGGTSTGANGTAGTGTSGGGGGGGVSNGQTGSGGSGFNGLGGGGTGTIGMDAGGGGGGGIAGGGGGGSTTPALQGGGGGGGFGGSGGQGSMSSMLDGAGGAGGFGGGGGGAGLMFGGTPGGAGGFGGGGGGTLHSTGGLGGFGGGNGDANQNGGGGAALGGTIFVDIGASLTFTNAISLTRAATPLTPGAPGGDSATPGQTLGPDIFLASSGLIDFSISSPFTADSIASDQGLAGGSTTTGGIRMSGSSILTLSGTNSYTGSTMCDAGTVIASIDASLGSTSALASLEFNGGTLQTGAGFTTARPVTLNSGGGTINVTGGTPTFTGMISGPGGLTVNGGTVVLSTASNTFGSSTVGATVGSAGILRVDTTASFPSGDPVNLAASGATFSLLADVTIGDLTGVAGSAVTSTSNTLTFGTSTTPSATFAGNINTSLNLIKQGSGTAIFTGTANSIGSTTINAGTLQLGSPGPLPSGDLIFNGGILEFASGFGTNTLTFTSTTLNMSGGTFQTDSGVIATLNSSVSGAGALTKTGTGTLILEGGSSYMGGTNLNAGNLAIGNAAFLGPGTLVFNAGTLEFLSAFGSHSLSLPITLAASVCTFQTDTGVLVTLNGGISGPGGLTKTGPATLKLSVTNMYLGTTTISDGTLAIGSDTSFPFRGTLVETTSTAIFDISNGFSAANPTVGDLSGVSGSAITLGTGTLTVGTSNASTYSGNITGTSGGVTKQGSGTLTLDVSSTNSYMGTTEVSAGTLFVNGTIANSPVLVDSGATLGGTGTVAAVTLNGTIAPGNSIGTINTGSFTFNPGSNYALELNNTVSDLINSSGTVTIQPGSTVTLVPLGLTSPAASYTIITAASVDTSMGQFTLVNNTPRFKFALVYDPTDVKLTFTGVTSFSQIVTSGNAGSAAKCFDSLINSPSPTINGLLTILDGQTDTELVHSFNQMQPANLNNIAFAEENVAERIRQIYTDHIYDQRTVPCEEKGHWRLWAAPFVEKARQHGHGMLYGYKETFAGFTAAADYLTRKHWTFIGGFSFASSNMSVPHGRTHADFKTYAGSIGTGWTDKYCFVDALFSYLYNSVDAKRKMHFSSSGGSLKLKAHHEEHDNEYLGHIGGGRNIRAYSSAKNTFNIYPYANLDYVFISDNSYTESGARRLDLKVKSKKYDYLRPEGGLGIGYIGCFKNANVQFDVTTSYVREFRYLGQKTQSHFVGNPCTIHSKGLKPENNLVCPSARLRIFTSTNQKVTSFTLGYHGEYGEHFVENAGEAELKLSF